MPIVSGCSVTRWLFEMTPGRRRGRSPESLAGNAFWPPRTGCDTDRCGMDAAPAADIPFRTGAAARPGH